MSKIFRELLAESRKARGLDKSREPVDAVDINADATRQCPRGINHCLGLACQVCGLCGRGATQPSSHSSDAL